LPQRDIVIDDEDGRDVKRRSCAHDTDGFCDGFLSNILKTDLRGSKRNCTY
jgi:hypothetical protein